MKEKEIKGVQKYITNVLGQKEYFWSWKIIPNVSIKNGESFEVKITTPYLSIKKLKDELKRETVNGLKREMKKVQYVGYYKK